MLYIFISGYHDAYRANLYRTLFLPVHTINKYVFKREGLTAILDKIDSQQSGSQAVIVFVDRYHPDGYKYYPIRRATYKEHQDVNGGRVKFYVELEDYIFPKNCEGVQADIKRLNHFPTKSEDAGDPTKDGQYITVCDDNILGSNFDDVYYAGDSGWYEAVKALKGKRAFLAKRSEDLDDISEQDLNQRTPFFFRIEYQKNELFGDSFKDVHPENNIKNHEWESYFIFSSENKCRAKIYFYFPLWENDRSATVTLQIKNENTGYILNTSLIAFKDQTDDPEEQRGDRLVQFPVPDSECEIFFEVLSQNVTTGKSVVSSGGGTQFRIRNYRMIKNLTIVGCAAIYVISGLIGGHTDENLTTVQYIIANTPQLIANALQVGAVILITKLNGGKKLI